MVSDRIFDRGFYFRQQLDAQGLARAKEARLPCGWVFCGFADPCDNGALQRDLMLRKKLRWFGLLVSAK